MPTETTLAVQLAEDAVERSFATSASTPIRPGLEDVPEHGGPARSVAAPPRRLEQIGLADVTMDEHGYVTATLPATVEHEVPTIALFAHVDTAREVSGAGVSPQRLRYEGGEIAARRLRTVDPRTAQSPDSKNDVGTRPDHDDGTTLLGADDKAGVAEIMAAIAHLAARPEIPHGTVKDRLQPRRGSRARRRSIFGRDLRDDRRLHRRRLHDRRAASRDIPRRAGAHAIHGRVIDPGSAKGEP